MQSNISKYKEDLENLIVKGEEMFHLLSYFVGKAVIPPLKIQKSKELKYSFETEYQKWFTEATVVIKQLLKDRLSEFESYYRSNPKRKNIDFLTYSIQDWLQFLVVSDGFDQPMFNHLSAMLSKFNMQLDILKSIERRF